MQKLLIFFTALLMSCTTSHDKPPGTAWQSPGTAAHSDDLLTTLRDRWQHLPADHEVRSRHVEDDGFPRFANRLLLESSPYLRQHAHNPVDWYPWGPEAFERAARENKPVFLSVGYATCHWCHVMEEESFEDLEIAQYLNENFVCIKVDREERPDVDSIYMSAVQAIHGRGGWPMSVWMTPEAKPFYAGTYFPPRDGVRGARQGFLTLLQRITTAWTDQRARIDSDATSISAQIRDSLAQRADGDLPSIDVLDDLARTSAQRFDHTWGGVGSAPKFPSSTPLRALLRHHARTGEAGSRDMVTVTLDRMAAGGVYDHVGGGFHRYSTDRQWLVPHFEKMLYDNAMLAIIYLEAWQLTADPAYEARVRDVLSWMRDGMRGPGGGFYTATDADSADSSGRREEGLYFAWTPDQLEMALGAQQARVVADRWGVVPGGHMDGLSVLHEAKSIAEVARLHNLHETAVHDIMSSARTKLSASRDLRAHPLRDEKMLAAWNGLAISAFARAGWVLDDPDYIAVAAQAADYVLAHHRVNGRLHRSVMDGEARHNAYLDDHAFIAASMVDLFEATGDSKWLAEAIDLDTSIRTRFEDPEGGWFYTASDHEVLLARERQDHDGAIPSGSSVHMLTLLRLGELTAEPHYLERANAGLRAQAMVLKKSPLSLSEAMLAVDWVHARPMEIVIVAPSSRAQAAPLLDVVRRRFLPNSVLVVTTQAAVPQVAGRVPLVDAKVALDGKATAYLCERGLCLAPTHDPHVLAASLDAWSTP